MSTATYYTYDKSHRITSQYVLLGEAHYYAYNQRNMVTQIQDVGGASDPLRAFVYNGLGERVVASDNATGSPAYWSYDRRKLLQDKQKSGSSFSTTNYRHNATSQDCPLGSVVEEGLSDATSGFVAFDETGSVTNIQNPPSGPNDNFVSNRFGETIIATNNFLTRPRSYTPDGRLESQTTQEVQLRPFGTFAIPSKNVKGGGACGPGQGVRSDLPLRQFAIMNGTDCGGVSGIINPWGHGPVPNPSGQCQPPPPVPYNIWVLLADFPNCFWDLWPDYNNPPPPLPPDPADCDDPGIQDLILGDVARAKTYAPPIPKWAVRKASPLSDAAPLLEGFLPKAPTSVFTAAEHALGDDASPFVSASEFLFGAKNFSGTRYWIDVERAEAGGAQYVSRQALGGAVDQLVASDPARFMYRASKWRSKQPLIEAEALFKGRVPPNAVSSGLGASCRVLGRVATGVAVATTGLSLEEAAERSLDAGSARPLAAEAVRQGFSWSGAWAGFEGGFAGGATLGIESGPGLLLTGMIGGVVGSIVMGFAGDQVAEEVEKPRR